MRVVAQVLLLTALGCGRIGFDPTSTSGDGGAGDDAPGPMETRIDPLGAPARLTTVSAGWALTMASLTESVALAWGDTTGTGTGGAGNITFARIAQTGEIITGPAAVITNQNSETPQLVPTPGGLAMAYRDDGGNGDARIVRLSPDGGILAGPVVLSAGPGTVYAPRLAATPAGFTAVWTQMPSASVELMAATITPGVTAGTAPVMLQTNAAGADVAWAADRHVVVYRELTGGIGGAGLPVTQAFAPDLSPLIAPIAVASTNTAVGLSPARVVATAAGPVYAIATRDASRSRLVVSRFVAGSLVEAEVTTPPAEPQDNGDLVDVAGRVVAYWLERDGAGHDRAMLRVLEPDGTLRAPLVVASAPSGQTLMRSNVVWTGTTLAVATITDGTALALQFYTLLP